MLETESRIGDQGLPGGKGFRRKASNATFAYGTWGLHPRGLGPIGGRQFGGDSVHPARGAPKRRQEKREKARSEG